MSSSLARKRFFDTQVKMRAWQDSMSGKNEEPVLTAFNSMGFNLNEDFKRQYPIGCRYVCDFAFVNEKVCVEVDGTNHLTKKGKKSDKKRDKFFYENGWCVIRIPEKQFFKVGPGTFWRALVQEVVYERRKQYEGGELKPIEIPEYEE